MADINHDTLQFCVYFFKCPAQTFAVLGHFQSRCSNTAGVCSFTRSKDHAVFLQIFCCIHSSRHISTFAYSQASVCCQLFCIVDQQFILSCTWKSNITFYAPYAASFMVFSVWSVVFVFGQSCTFYFFDLFKCCYIDSVRIVYPAGRITCSNHFCTQLLSFFDRIDSNVAGTGYTNSLASQFDTVQFQQFLCQVEQTITGSFCSCKGSTVA